MNRDKTRSDLMSNTIITGNAMGFAGFTTNNPWANFHYWAAS